jgi:hypothetical protein
MSIAFCGVSTAVPGMWPVSNLLMVQQQTTHVPIGFAVVLIGVALVLSTPQVFDDIALAVSTEASITKRCLDGLDALNVAVLVMRRVVN